MKLAMQRLSVLLISLLFSTCATAGANPLPFEATPVARFDQPWAMTFLPDGRLLVTEKAGRLMLVSVDGVITPLLEDVPGLAYGGQGGVGDVVLHPDFPDSHLIYLSYAESGKYSTSGAAVARARLDLDSDVGPVDSFEVIWRQDPKVPESGHYGHRIAFSPDGYLFITSGERQKFDPAQDLQTNLGKIVRLRDDGSVPDDNPFAGQGGVTAQIWTLGHKNPLGLAFDAAGRLWSHEMGPRHACQTIHAERG